MATTIDHTNRTPATFPLGPFTPYAGNPVMRPRGEGWESANVYNAAATVVGERVALLYRAHAADLVSHIGLAWSDDGFAFERLAEPIVSPTEDYETHGCEDPRIALIDGTYYLTYTGWDLKSAQLCLATSTDLLTWEKHGPLFPGFNTFLPAWDGSAGAWSKAGAILETPIDGRWLMYFGEGSLWYAWSDDLIHWTPCSNDDPLRGARPDGAALAQPVSWEDKHGLVSNVTFVEGMVLFRDTWFAYYGQSDSTLAVATCPVGAGWPWRLAETPVA